MTTITVTGNEDYRDGTPAITPVVDQIAFTNAATATAIFGSNQFGGLISNTVAITGNASNNRIQVNFSATGAFSAAGWTFTNWTEGVSDLIGISGTAGADTITGSSKTDFISGGAGADSLAGGAGDDEFQYSNNTVAAGEQIDGGAGSDRIQFLGAAALANDFSGATIIGVERLVLITAGAVTATFKGSQLGSGAITAIEGGGGAAQSIIVNGGKVDLSTLTFTGWGAANQTITINGAGVGTLTGSSQKDTINGGASGDTITGGGGGDTLNGAQGDDTFIFAAIDSAHNDAINGGPGADTLRVTAADGVSFTVSTLSSIERLELLAEDAVFKSDQFGAGLSNALAITGDAQANEIRLNLAIGQTAFDASGWTFDPSWSAADHVTFNGTDAIADTLTGSIRSDIFDGDGGADILSGLAGDDTFRFDAGEVANGLSLNGGDGLDRIQVRLAPNSDFRTVAIAGVERLTMSNSGDSAVTFLGSQIGAGGITDIVSQDAGARSITVHGNSVNLSALTFTGWGAANRTITINGSNTIINNLTGSRQNDIINGNGGSIDIMRGGLGADTLNGGLDNDIFVYGAEDEATTGEIISGGAGSDIIRMINAGGNDFADATITGVETLDFQSGDSLAVLSAAQIGAGAGSILSVDGGTGPDNLSVRSTTGANLSGVSFASWTKGVDFIRIFGGAANETLIGSSQDDIFFGEAGTNDMTGLAGDDEYVVDSATDKVNEAVGGGNDRVSASVSYILQAGSEIERFDIRGSVNAATLINLTGNEFGQTITGHDGANLILGRGGADTIDGDSGVDTASYGDKNTPVVVFIDGATAAVVTVNGAAEDTVRNIENVFGGFGGDTLVGDSLANELRGGGGADFLFSQGFNPDGTMKTGAGNDTLRGEDGDDGLFAGDGADTLNGGDGNDGMVGGAGNDTLNGGIGGDFLFGGSFSTVDGSFLAGSGDDTLNGGDGNDGLYGFDGADTINADSGDDYVEGGAGNDVMNGGAGSDFLLGQGDNDTINGGAGFDFMFGAAGADTFVFSKSDSADWILDFSAAQGDRLRFTSFGFANFAAIPLVDLSSPGNPAVQMTFIENGNVDQLTIFGVTLAQLNAANVLVA